MSVNEFLHKILNKTYDSTVTADIINGLSKIRKTTFRVNSLKSDDESVLNVLSENGISYQRSEAVKNAYILTNYPVNAKADCKSNVSIESLDIYKDGKIYLQSISSMIPSLVINPMQHENILDMCAAPGGKATHLAALSDNKASITAVELHKDRYERLKYNINLQKANVFALNISSLDLDDRLRFDKILIDAPCSGSGTLDISNDRYEKFFTPKLIEKCVTTQKKLIKKAFKLLKSGGVLVYSTCSLLQEENEDIAEFAVNLGFDLDIENIERLACDVGIEKLSHGSSFGRGTLKIFPDDVYEGFFISRFIKK